MKTSNDDIRSIVNSSLFKLLSWIEKNGWAGYDPYDLKGIPFYLFLYEKAEQGNIFFKTMRRLFFELERTFPLLMRKLFKVEKQINPKSIGLLAKGYLNLFQFLGDEIYLQKAKDCLGWLENNYSKGYHGLCWGYPFDWHSRILIPKGTPSAVVSSIVGDAFWQAYKLTNEERYLEVCRQVCIFFLNDLNIDEIEGDCLCFSYTPIDKFHVHNANLFVAEFLIRVGVEVGEPEWVEIGLKAAKYALKEQNPDGSIYYWGKVDNRNNFFHIDAYHSGFEIRMLFGIWKTTGKKEFFESVKRYFEFYKKNLLFYEGEKIIPKMTPHSLYPIDIHSCAEAILCNSIISDDFEEAKVLSKEICKWVIKNMQSPDGWFYYAIKNFFGLPFTIKIPYFRWGQAWMFLALSYVISTL